jgi:hypothetical protein
MKDIQSIQRIVKDDRLFKALNDVAGEMIRNWVNQGMIRDTEWKTACAAVEKESKVKALVLFMEELEKIASEV